MPTVPKPYTVLINENKSHRTKSELKQRKNEEAALLTGAKLKERPEVKENPIAHKEFLRINKLLESIEKNDAIYEPIINRYCILQAECLDFEEKRDNVIKSLGRLTAWYDENKDNIDFMAYSEKQIEYYKQLMATDKQIQAKRKMLLDIEKENIMTIAAALRSIPKKPEAKENKLLEALNGN